MSDSDDILTESDEENEIQDLQQLTAVLVNDEPCSSTSASQYSSTALTSCTSASKYEQYSKVEAAIALNTMCDEKLRRLEKVLTNRLQECREKLKEIQDCTQTECDSKTEVFYYVSCGRPYFKDSLNFPAPDNEDMIVMAKSEMYDFSQITSVSGWTVRDKSNFLKLIHVMSQEKKKEELNSKIAELMRQKKTSPTKSVDKKIAVIKSQIDRVKHMSLDQLALPIYQEYDWYAIANKLNKRHNANEYRSLWKLFLHPSINKRPWNRTEHVALQKIAYEEKLHDWDKIAKRLNTGRTNYQCFVYFRTNMSNTFTGRKWSKEEVEYLKRLINYYREDNYIPWGKVATSMENRTKIQIYNKYLGLCQYRKGRFLPEEDAVILTCAERFGPNFQKMTKYLPGRSTSQCRVRYQVLAKRRISTVWTIDEDRRLVQLMANQDSTTNYSSITKYFPGKDRVNIRARYLTLTKWMKRNPTADIAKAPRRGARRLGHGHSSADLSKAIENLKNRIQSEVNDVKNKRLSIDSPEDMIDDAITAYFITENARYEETKKMELLFEDPADMDCDVVNATYNSDINNLRKILILLRANLNKERFMTSPMGNQFSALLRPDPETLLVKIKSYSKKNSVRNITVDGVPDIWGNVRLGPLAYVLPPHYATITGCKKVISYLASKPNSDEHVNVKVVERKNNLLKEQIFVLMERFNSLFLWPMLLSNTPPGPSLMNNREQQKVSDPMKPNVAYSEEAFVITLPSYMKSDAVSNGIEAEDNNNVSNGIDIPVVIDNP